MSCTTTSDLPSPVAPRPSKLQKGLRDFKQSKAVKFNPLSFDMLINGYSCSPCTIRDFMNYLLYIERAAENLQFYLWLKDYTRRFALIPDSERELSPAWTDKKQIDGLSYRNRSAAVSGNISQSGEPMIEPPDVAFDRQSITSAQTSFSAGDGSIRAASDAGLSPWDGLVDFSPRLKPENMKQLEELPELSLKNGKDQQLLMSQPFRMEVSRIVAIYVVDGAPRQLNLTAKERDSLLRALSTTTHPTAFDEVAAGVEWFLRQQSHPNFIRWSRYNSNRSRVLCARMFGGLVTVLGLIAGMLPIFSKASRAWRIFSVLLLLPGLLIFVAAWKGACVLFLCMDRRHLHPWEFFGEENEHTLQKLGMYNGKAFDVLGGANSYEDEPWIPKYQKRNFLRRVFDPAARIQDPEMRRIQRLVLLKVVIVSCFSCAVLLAIFIAVPRGNFF